MGRNKIKIARLEKPVNRQITYSKRKHGITKKVKDLSELCDVDVGVLMFSPGTGRPTLCLGESRDLESILQKLSQLSFHEREGRIRESMDHVKKMMRKVGHHVETSDFFPESMSDNVKKEVLRKRLQDIDRKVEEATYKLRCWESPASVTDMKMLDEMEEILRRNLGKLRLMKFRDAASLIKEDDVEALTEEEIHEEELLKDTPVSDINDNDQAEDNIEEEVATDMGTRQLRTNRNQRPSRFGEFSVNWSG